MNISMSRSAIEFLPWTEGYQRAQKEKNTVLFSTARLPEREKLFKWVGPIRPVKGVLISKSNNNVTIQSDSDIKKYKIGWMTSKLPMCWEKGRIILLSASILPTP
jgi:polar amino acid transport system substrate-binding protein